MTFWDAVRFAWRAIRAHRLRTALTILGIVIGITSVVLLTAIGEGTRRYVLHEFTQFGTNIMTITPGRIATTGIPGAIGATVRKLTLDDADAVARVEGVERVVPVVAGTGRVEAGPRGRSVFVYGVTSDLPEVLRLEVRQGRFLPPVDPRRSAPLAVLGPTLKRELFGEANALGTYVRIAGQRFLVVGVMAPKGQILGIDVDDTVYIPVASAQRLFGRDELMEIDVLFSPRASVPAVKAGVTRVLKARHDGEEDFTLITQTEMLATMDRVLGIVGAVVGGIGGISLVVGAIGILTVMWMAVGERTSEIGVVRALGATPGEVLRLFLLEAALLATAGAFFGVLVALGLTWVVRLAFPGLPLQAAPAYAAAAIVVGGAVGLVSGVLPARRAARLDPIEALRAE